MEAREGGGAGGGLCHHELSSSLMLPSARSQALPMVSLYASREFARGSANGTAAIFPFYSGKAGNPLPPHAIPPALSALSFALYDLRTSSAPGPRIGRQIWEPIQTLKLAPLDSSNLPAVKCDGKRWLRRCAEGVEIKNHFAGTAQSRIVSPSTGGDGGMKTQADSIRRRVLADPQGRRERRPNRCASVPRGRRGKKRRK